MLITQEPMQIEYSYNYSLIVSHTWAYQTVFSATYQKSPKMAIFSIKMAASQRQTIPVHMKIDIWQVLDMSDVPAK